MASSIEIIVNTSELTAGTRGASLGPGAIMAAARSQNNPFFGLLPIHPLPDLNHYIDQPVTTPFAKRIDGYSEVFHAVRNATRTLLSNGKFPLILSGDHGSAAGTIAGMAEALPGKQIGVVWIDAHADLHSPYTTPSGNMHGMPLALSLAADNEKRRRNAPDAHTVAAWDALKQVGGIQPKIHPQHLVYVAVRDTESEEETLMEDWQITNHTVESIRKNGVDAITEAINQQLAACDYLYVSFDVDSMDPQLTSFGTGTPVGNGITPEEATALLKALAANPKTVCMEFVEVNPCLDNKLNTMAETAFSLISAVTDQLTQRL